MRRIRGNPLLFLLAAFTVACEEPREDIAKQVPGTPDLEDVDPSGAQVVFWYQHTQMREEALLGLIEDFNRTNQHGIRVLGEFAGRYSDIYNKMMVGLQGGELPELVVAYQNQAIVYDMGEGLVDLSPYMSSPKWGLSASERGDFIQAFLAQDFINGKQICFPPNRSLEILYYNADWLRELGEEVPPATWEEFARLCRLAESRPFQAAQPGSRSKGYLFEAEASRMATMVFTRGGDFMNVARTAYTLDTPEMQQALTMVQGLIREGAVDLLGERYEDQTGFALGQVLFMIRSSSGLPFVASALADAPARFAWDVAPPPRAGEDPVLNAYGASVSVCRSAPEKQLASWLFLKWFTAPEQQARWVRASNYFPVRRSTAAQLAGYFEENPRYGKAYGFLDFGKAEPSVPGYEAVRRKIAETMVEVAQGGEIPPVLQRLEKEANLVLQEFRQ